MVKVPDVLYVVPILPVLHPKFILLWKLCVNSIIITDPISKLNNNNTVSVV